MGNDIYLHQSSWSTKPRPLSAPASKTHLACSALCTTNVGAECGLDEDAEWEVSNEDAGGEADDSEGQDANTIALPIITTYTQNACLSLSLTLTSTDTMYKIELS